ncbi:alginate export family protein [Campylobacterota bacterium]
MIRLIFILLISALLCADQNTSLPDIQDKADEALVFSGHYRGRFDIYDGVNKAAYGDKSIDAKGNVRGDSSDTIYLQQIITGFTYTPNMDWEFKAYMYDSRSWGSSLDADDFTKNPGTADQYRMSYYDDHLELFETYIRKHHFFSKELTFTLGRQQLGYGDRRVFGPGKWGNTMGWLWDAAHLSYKKEKDFVDLWYGQTRIKEPNDFSITNKHRYQGVGVYTHYEASSVKIEPFVAWRNTLYHDEVPNENAYYYGMRLYDTSPGLIYDATAIKAFGSYGNLDIDAYAYAAKIGYQFNNHYQPKFTVGSVYATGDKDPNDSTKQTFSAPFGANDGLHYGRMDIMFWVNMQDYQASLSFKPTKKLFIETAYHHFKLAEANDKWYFFGYTNKTGNAYTDIGDEYDLIVKYQATKDLSLLAIGSYLNAGDFITKNDIASNNASKVFLQFLYKFTLQ